MKNLTVPACLAWFLTAAGSIVNNNVPSHGGGFEQLMAVGVEWLILTLFIGGLACKHSVMLYLPRDGKSIAVAFSLWVIGLLFLWDVSSVEMVGMVLMILFFMYAMHSVKKTLIRIVKEDRKSCHTV